MALGARYVERDRPTLAGVNGAVHQPRGYTYYSAAFASSPSGLALAGLYDIQSYSLDVLWLLGATKTFIAWSSVGLAGAVNVQHPPWAG